MPSNETASPVSRPLEVERILRLAQDYAVATFDPDDVPAINEAYKQLADEIARLARERDEMKDALRRIGVFRSDEAGDDGSEWCVTFEPRGEEPIGTLDEALAEVERVTYSDGARDERKRLQSALDALAVAVKGCDAELPDGALCGEYDATRIALCPTCARKRDTALLTLTTPSDA